MMRIGDASAVANGGCSDGFEEDLNLFVDGELPAERQPALFKHLSSCGECRSTLDAVLRFRRYGRQEHITLSAASDDAFLQRLARLKNTPDRVDREAERKPIWNTRRRVSMRSAGLLAIGIFLAGVLIPLLSSPDERTRIVSGLQERVDFSQSTQTVQEAVYVIYPGLTVEALKPDESESGETL